MCKEILKIEARRIVVFSVKIVVANVYISFELMMYFDNKVFLRFMENFAKLIFPVKHLEKYAT